MNIGMLLNAPYPSDLRVLKEAKGLINAGHKVFLLCLKSSNESLSSIHDGINVTRLSGGKNNFELAFWDIIISLTNNHPVFKSNIPKWVIKNKIEALHVHDLPLAGTAIKLKSKLKLPVIVDFHENYPDALEVWFQWKKNLLADIKNKLFMNPRRWRKHEAFAVKHADFVIAVVDEMKSRLIKNHHANEDKISVISNQEELSFIKQTEYNDIYNQFKDKFIITYSGNIGPHRGVDTVIDAMNLIKDIPEVIFLIIGSGNDRVMKMLKDKVTQHKLEETVFFLGRQPFEKFFSYMKFADANIIPHLSNQHTDNTIPHKLFQAMMVGKPVIVSSSDPLKRIVEKYNSGIIFKAGDANDLALKIRASYKSLSKSDLGKNGISATLHGNENWEAEQLKLVSLYNNIRSNN